MNARDFKETECKYFELGGRRLAASREFHEYCSIDVDGHGQMMATTIEHSRDRSNPAAFLYERVTA